MQGVAASSFGRLNEMLPFNDNLLNEVDKEMSRRLLTECALLDCSEGYLFAEENGVILLRFISCCALGTFA